MEEFVMEERPEIGVAPTKQRYRIQSKYQSAMAFDNLFLSFKSPQRRNEIYIPIPIQIRKPVEEALLVEGKPCRYIAAQTEHIGEARFYSVQVLGKTLVERLFERLRSVQFQDLCCEDLWMRPNKYLAKE